MLPVEQIVREQRVDIIRRIDPGVGEMAVQRLYRPGQRIVEPPDIRQHNDIRQVTTGQRRVELLRRLLVVRPGVDEIHLEIRVLCRKAADQFGLDVLDVPDAGTRS
jgi:hypothetical protein